MPIRSKHTPGDRRLIAARQFTDREDFIATFRTALQKPQRTDPLVLVYYGVGGIGKSSLRRELVRQLADGAGTVTATLDFDVPSYRHEETALFVLRKAIHEAWRVKFPSFDLAFAVYWQKTHPQTPLSEETLPLLEPGSILSQVLDVAGNLTLIGLIPKVAAIAVQGGKDVHDWWQRRGNRELQDLPQMEPIAIAERLPMFWAADLKDYLQSGDTIRNRSDSSHVPGRRAVLFIDTYEALWETGRTEGDYFRRDEWVRELVAQLPEVLWVICGRERLRWEETDPDWAKCLSQHLVGGLADPDARRFLASCDITEETIQSAIMKGSQGVPHYLDLAVDTFLKIKQGGQRDPVESDFAGTPRDVFARFIRHLNQAEIETLKVLSAPRYWDYGLFELLINKYQTGYPLTAYDEFCRFSFIDEGAAPGTWTMHQLMRQSLQEYASPELVKRVHHFLFEQYREQLKELDIKGITDRQKAALGEAFHHGRAALGVQEFWRWLRKPAGQFDEAAQWRLLVPLFEQVGHDLEAALGPEHPDVAEDLSDLASLLDAQGKYAEAEPLHRRALAIREKVLGPEHPDVALSLNNLAVLLDYQGKYADAEPLHRRALAIREKALGPGHPDVAESLGNLAELLDTEGKHAEAEPLHWQALAIREKALGPEHLDVAMSVNNLAALLNAQGKYAEAEPLLRRTLAIREKALGSEHPLVATGLNNLAWVLYSQGKYAEAEPLHRRSLATREQVLGPEHPEVAHSLCNLAVLLYTQGRYAEAEPLLRRALAIREKVLGPEHPSVAYSLNNLAALFRAQDKCVEAEPLFRRALAIVEKALGPEHPEVATSLNNLAMLLEAQGKHAEVEPLYRRALAIVEKELGPEHPSVALSLNNLAMLLNTQGKYAEAEPLFRRALAIWEKALGPEHPNLAASLHNLAGLLRVQGKYADAEPMFRRALDIWEKALGPEHPNTATSLNDLADLLQTQDRYVEAEPLLRRALLIREKALGPDHPNVAKVLEGLAKLYDQTGRGDEAAKLEERAKQIRARKR